MIPEIKCAGGNTSRKKKKECDESWKKNVKKNQKHILYDFSYKNFKMKWNQPRVWKVRIGFTLEGTMRGVSAVGNDPFCVLSVGYMSRFTL